MFRLPVKQWGVWSRSALAAVIAVVAVATLLVSPAFADPPGLQIEDFYYPDGTQVMSDGGMPYTHAALFRFADQQTSGLMWQIMTQRLTPGTRYDIWIEGSNDGTDEGAFQWWVGSFKATPRGDLNVIGRVYTGVPRGAFTGQFTNPGAPLYLVITTTSGEPVQAAFFPGS